MSDNEVSTHIYRSTSVIMNYLPSDETLNLHHKIVPSNVCDQIQPLT